MKDYFSTQSATYRAFRPGYPAALFDALVALMVDGVGRPAADCRVWDCATGNGQAAGALAERVGTVLASDLSLNQLREAEAHNNVHYLQALAEQMPLADRSVSLVTVAQALHWFDFERFYAEVRRVVAPGGVVAAWTYSFLSVSDQLGADIDGVVRRFYHDVIGPYWPAERRWVDERYATIPFPFEPLTLPTVAIDVGWDLPGVLGYIGSWSATARYREALGEDPMPQLAADLAQVWGAPETVRALSWPLSVRVGQVG